MKTYSDLQHFFEREIEQFPPSVDQPMTVEEIENLPSFAIEYADDACMKFVSTLEWPDMMFRLRFLIFLRLSFARDDASLMNYRYPGCNLPEEMDGREILEFALIHRWHKEGMNWFREVYLKRKSTYN